MLKSLSVLLCCLCLTACVFSSGEQVDKPQEQLLVEKITTDAAENKDIRQINIHFNRDIALLGSVPTAQQVQAVKLSHSLNQQCQWRFIQLNILSCDLKTSLKYMTHYQVSIDDSFSALGKTLAEPASLTLSTPVPKISINVEIKDNQFPTHFQINYPKEIALSREQLARGVKLVSPTGIEYPVTIVEKKKSYGGAYWDLSPQEFPTAWLDGEYHFILPKGYRASDEQYILEEDVALEVFKYSKQLKFYGFYSFECGERGADCEKFNYVEINDKGELPIRPESVWFAFSGDSKLLTQLKWISGGNAKLKDVWQRSGEVLYEISLDGETQYKIDLSDLALIDNKIETPQVIEFKTRPATPKWEISSYKNSVVESQYDSLPIIRTRNLDKLIQKITPINSVEQLQQFMNGELKSIVEPLAENPKAKHSISSQSVDFRKYLTSSSGLVNIEFSGKSENYHREIESLQRAVLFNAVDHNLVIWQGNELVVQVFDWDALPVVGAQVSLVCKGQKSPISIGKTDKQGLLWLAKESWRQHKELVKTEQSCMLWSDYNGQISVGSLIEIPQYFESFGLLKAMAWTTQPLYQVGDSVDLGFIARYRDDNGITPLKSMEGYQLILRQPNGKELPLDLSSLSDMGFAETNVLLKEDMPQGNYNIKIKELSSDKSYTIGYFIVTEFTPPEFELSTEFPQVVLKNAPLTIGLTHRRMNGVALKQAKANVYFEIENKRLKPNNWPKGYKYLDWDAFKDNENGKEKGHLSAALLENDGHSWLEIENYQSTVPYGEMNIITEVIAQDGSSLKDWQRLPYFSRNHYIGTRYNEEHQRLEIIAIDHQGKQLDTPVTVNAYRPAQEQEKPDVLVKSCSFSQLPANCYIPQEKESLDVKITSGQEHYSWLRTIYSNTPKRTYAHDLKNNLKLSVDKPKSISVNQPLKITLQSPHSGVANFILKAGGIKKVWQQPIEEGVNTLELTPDETWIPSAVLYASLSVSRETANDAIEKQLARLSTDKNNIDRHLNALGAQRFLSTELSLVVKSDTYQPKVKITSDTPLVLAGDEIKITVASDKNAEAQLWLLNDALINYFPYTMEGYDFTKTIYKREYYANFLHVSELSSDLVLSSLLDGGQMSFDIGGISVGSTRHDSKSTSTTPLNLTNAIVKNKDQFVQSKMLQRLELKAGEPQTISVQLPQLVGRWKVVALTATKLTSSIATLDITTKRPVEYFVDAPTDVYQMDLSQLAVTAINQQEKQIEDTLSLWDGDVLIGEKKLRLAAEEQRRIVFDMPTLATGDHLLRVTSELDSDYVNYHQVSVAPPIYQQRQQWLVKPSQSQQIIKPSAAIEGSISLNYQSLANQAIDWRALASYNQSYPYQCWEQTISRALSYQSNPLASEAWPKGKEILRNEIASRTLSRGNISYFEGMKSDKFLLAYTYLVNAWMKDGLSTKLPAVDSYGGLKDSFDVRYETPNKLERSMALLALATRGDITLDDALKQRQDIGFSGPFANVLQALALKTLGADKALYLDNLSVANDNTYLDESTNIYNDTAQQCFAALVYEQGSIEREQLTSRVIAKQQQLGHFGSTFANGVCSYLLKDQGVKENAQPKSLKFTQAGNQLQYQLPEQQAHWLTMEYQLPLTEVTAQNAGLDLKRQRFVRVDGKWQAITRDTNLRVGNLVKTTLSIGSAIPRTHIAITDDVAGGLEVISPWLQNVFYKDSSSREWKSNNHIDIQDGRVTWYLLDLQDKDSYSYYSRVRHVGEFQTGPAIAEAMYRTDVKARTSSSRVVINE